MQNVPWNFERFLFWWSLLGALFLTLTFANRLWPFPFTNPNPTAWQLHVGLAYDLGNFTFSILAYFLVRAGRRLVCFTVVAAWIIAKLFYAAAFVVTQPFSAWAVGIPLGELLQCAFLIYLSVSEAKSNGLLRGPSA